VAVGRHARDVHPDHRPGLRLPRRARVPEHGDPASNAGSSRTTIRPVPCSRTMFGPLSEAQNITQIRPFFRRWATVSTPLGVDALVDLGHVATVARITPR
jgi:hypothetical protein